MKINKRRVVDPQKYLILLEGNEFRISSPIISDEILKKLRLSKLQLLDGCSILPERVGSVSNFNADGKDIIRKDLAKKIRQVGERNWSWKDWGGNEHDQTVDIEKKCYQRDFISPPSKEIIFHNDMFYSEILDKKDTEDVKHTINLFLELFSSCEIVKANFENFPKIEKKNWIILPPGEYPFEKIREYIESRVQNSDFSSPITERHEFFYGQNPEKIATGVHGFSGYIMYFFRKYLILDCVKYGNAIYVFNKSNEDICSLSKKEILDNSLNIDRIVHNKSWKAKVMPYFKKAKK